MSKKEDDSLLDPELIAKIKKITGLTPTELVDGLRDQIKNASIEERFRIAARTPLLAGVVYQMNEAEAHRRAQSEKKPIITGQVYRPTVMQGGIRRSSGGLHTPTMAEIVAQANQPDPTKPYFDPNSDRMRQIDPLESHYDLSGDFPKLVNPLKPGPKIRTNG